MVGEYVPTPIDLDRLAAEHARPRQLMVLGACTLAGSLAAIVPVVLLGLPRGSAGALALVGLWGWLSFRPRFPEHDPQWSTLFQVAWRATTPGGAVIEAPARRAARRAVGGLGALVALAVGTTVLSVPPRGEALASVTAWALILVGVLRGRALPLPSDEPRVPERRSRPAVPPPPRHRDR